MTSALGGRPRPLFFWRGIDQAAADPVTLTMVDVIDGPGRQSERAARGRGRRGLWWWYN